MTALAAKNAAVRGTKSWHLALDKFPYFLDAHGQPTLNGKSFKTDRLKQTRDAFARAKHDLEHALKARRSFLDALEKQHGPRFRRVTLVNSSRLLLHLGRASVLENVGLYADRTTGLPLIPGSAVKGVVSTWACWEAHAGSMPGGELAKRDAMSSLAALVLGDDSATGSKHAGAVCFLGGFPCEPPVMELDITTPHHHPDGSAQSPVPNPFLSCKRGTTWEFPLLVSPGVEDATELLNQAELWLTESLVQFGLGAKTSAGYGRFRLKNKDSAPASFGTGFNLGHEELRLRLLTPAWCGGSDPEGEAEMRIPTLRGQWRWWLRLLYPGQRLDESILGTCHGGRVLASKLAFAFKQELGGQKIMDWAAYRQSETDPEGYFLWPLQTKKHGVFPVPGKPPLFSLDVTTLATLSTQEQDAWQHAIEAWTLLGSFGMRSSRGYGCVWPDGLQIASEDELKSKLSFLPASIEVRLLAGPGLKTSREALGEAARWLRKHRAGKTMAGMTASKWGKNDHDVSAKPALAADDLLYRPALGLPLNQTFGRNTPGQKTVKTTINGSDRWPSPLHLRIIMLGGVYRVLAIIFRDLLPDPVTMQVEINRRPVRLSLDLINHLAVQGAQIH